MNRDKFSEAIEELKRRISMPDVLLRYGIVLPRNRKISCPFHKEKTASLHIYEDHFYCFGCGAFGDIVDFVAQIEGLNKYDAYLELGGKEYKAKNPKARQAMDARKKLEQKVKLQEEQRNKLLEKIGKLRECYQKAVPFSEEWKETYEELTRTERKLDALETGEL